MVRVVRVVRAARAGTRRVGRRYDALVSARRGFTARSMRRQRAARRGGGAAARGRGGGSPRSPGAVLPSAPGSSTAFTLAARGPRPHTAAMACHSPCTDYGVPEYHCSRPGTVKLYHRPL